METFCKRECYPGYRSNQYHVIFQWICGWILISSHSHQYSNDVGNFKNIHFTPREMNKQENNGQRSPLISTNFDVMFNLWAPEYPVYRIDFIAIRELFIFNLKWMFTKWNYIWWPKIRIISNRNKIEKITGQSNSNQIFNLWQFAMLYNFANYFRGSSSISRYKSKSKRNSIKCE